MRAFDVMSSPAVTVSPQATVEEAAALVAEHGFAALPVVGGNGELVGLVSGEDLLREQLRARSSAPRVADAMTPRVVAVDADMPVGEVARQLLGHHYRSLPVVWGGAVIGVVSREDLMRALMPQDEATAARVSKLLCDNLGARSWDVVVLGGAATVLGTFHDRGEELTATALAGSVPGVCSVVVQPCAPPA
ncbi:CBS domain-containing protein [Lentzea sp. BCCO 10_0798]|uniref:CBS domain-containing protein n=1 Tax=Lentzea kristufekii TaxID=3095430 RepID=A0ABU4TVE2_9PSEU|nr:CBS domain-containing protein [Lentzea sp. BCCO 10_0798]MDX8052155.1 CBS domain-containing protein [Lentzea sp. BCCO 10_0798]